MNLQETMDYMVELMLDTVDRDIHALDPTHATGAYWNIPALGLYAHGDWMPVDGETYGPFDIPDVLFAGNEHVVVDGDVLYVLLAEPVSGYAASTYFKFTRAPRADHHERHPEDPEVMGAYVHAWLWTRTSPEADARLISGCVELGVLRPDEECYVEHGAREHDLAHIFLVAGGVIQIDQAGKVEVF